MATVTVSTPSTISPSDFLIVTLNASEEITTSYAAVNVSGDIGVLDSAYQGLQRSGNGYWFYIRTLSSLGSNGGSFRVRLNRLSVTPHLDASVDVTVRWDASGTIEIIETADIVYPELAISLNLDYVAISDEITATFRFTEVGSQIISEFSAADVVVTEGITKGALTKVSNTEYSMVVNAPSSGNGQGVISVAENAVYPSNTAATATFIYIDAINAEISLSAAAIENGGTIIAQFDFDYDVPGFEGAFVAVNNPDAVIGSATALDPDSRCWVVPVTVPQAGEGELEIELPEDAIGFQSAAVMAPVQFAPTIALSIGSFASPLEWIFGIFRSVEIDITGNDIKSVRVTGLTRPFYSHWDATNGKLYLRGRPEVYYEDLAFTITVVDADDTATASGIINVVDVAPVIIPPVGTIQLAQGHKNSVSIEVQNFPKDGSVESDYLNLDHSLGNEGFTIEGDIPGRGSGANQAIFGVNSGELILNAENSGGSAMEVRAPWEFSSPTKPIWGKIQNYRFGPILISSVGTDYLIFPVNRDIEFNMSRFVNAVPSSNITMSELTHTQGNLVATALIDERNTLICRSTHSYRRRLSLTARNNIGAQPKRFWLIWDSSYVAPQYTGPTSISDITASIRRINSNTVSIFSSTSAPWQFRSYFNLSNNSIMAVSGFGEILGIDDNTVLYDPERAGLGSYRNHGPNDNDRDLPYMHVRFLSYIAYLVISAQRISESAYQAVRGTYSIRLKYTNLLGSAETPEFNLIIP